VSPAGRLNLDSGIFNMELLTRDYGDEVAKIWRKMRLKPAWRPLPRMSWQRQNRGAMSRH
jgi:hypothetical protein